MTLDPADATGVNLPSPESLQELTDALKTACGKVVAVRRQMEVDCQEKVDQIRLEAARSLESVVAAAAGQHRDLCHAVETATEKLADLEQAAATLMGKLKTELSEAENTRSRVDAAVEVLSQLIRQAQADREAWKAEGRAAEARHEAAVQELRHALSDEKAQVSKLRAQNKRLYEAYSTLEERLTVQEKKKVFGLF